ncbi:transporter [Bradyrhizobium xenonodulans]|uniref:Transporter n=1 Tax=Bradyrhizobium xenonodulans TaxID=2736875 RepID=A0ABY7MB42_9BRAD|nr:TrkA C-terminal domain-containing protein [Bradyrhizobium xenonodulans]WBL75480.1 transporter [Bradyrhizobium xenonodulans]
MGQVLNWLAAHPYILLFVVVAGAVILGNVSVKGYSLGMVASAIVVGAAISAWAASYGVKMKFDDFAKSLFYYLFMYGVGLRTGPSFVNSLKGDGLKFVFLAIFCSSLGMLGAVGFTKLWDMPTGTAGGLLAGSMTMSAALGSAEEAVRQGAVHLKPGETAEQVSSMIAVSYGLTYIWGTVGIILICKYLPRWWGVDARAAAKKYEDEFGVPNVDDAGLTGYRPLALRAYKLTNDGIVGWSVRQFAKKYPQYKVLNIGRSDHALGAPDELKFQKGDVLAIGGRLDAITENIGLVGPEVPDAKILNIPIDTAEILVTNKDVVGKELLEFRTADFAGQIALRGVERGGVPIPVGLHTKLQSFDVLFVSGVKSAVDHAAALMGKVARPSTATDLLMWGIGMILGFLIGLLGFPVAGSMVTLGAGAGLLVSGVIVSSIASRVRFIGNTPNAARNIIEDLGLVLFISMVGVNAGAALLSQLTGALTLKILFAGFICTTVPPILVWAIGYHLMNINAAVLMGGVAGARTHSGPAREAAKEIESSVPWVGFPVGYAVAGVLLTVGGYLSMALAT